MVNIGFTRTIPKNRYAVTAPGKSVIETGVADEQIDFGQLVNYDETDDDWGVASENDTGLFGIALYAAQFADYGVESERDYYEEDDLMAIMIDGMVVAVSDEDCDIGDLLVPDVDGKVQPADYDTTDGYLDHEWEEIVGKAMTATDGTNDSKLIIKFL